MHALLAHDHLNRRRAKHPVGVNIPSWRAGAHERAATSAVKFAMVAQVTKPPALRRYPSAHKPSEGLFLPILRRWETLRAAPHSDSTRPPANWQPARGNHPPFTKTKVTPPVVAAVAAEPFSVSLAMTSLGSLGKRGKTR